VRSVNTLLMSGRRSLSEQSKSSRVEKPGSKSENTRSLSTRHGCAKGMNDCDGGKTNSRPESYGPKRRRSACQVPRGVAPRSGVTNAAPAGQASSTSIAMACLVAGHNESP
jgi:hypothetical protein